MSLLPRKIVGIYFHDYSGQVVELKSDKDKISLEAYNRKLLPVGLINNGEIIKPEELKLFLADLLKEANPQSIEVKEFAIVFPAAKVFTHIFKFPPNLSKREIDAALAYEAETVIPFSINEVYWDSTVLEEEPEVNKKTTFQRVLFAAIFKETADKYIELFQSLGLTPSLFAISLESLKYGLIRQLEQTKNSLIIDVGTLSVNYLFIKDGIIKHFFSSNRGGKYLFNLLHRGFQIPEGSLLEQKEKNAWDERLLPGITSFIENNYKLASKVFEEEKGRVKLKDIDNVYLTGEFLNLPGFYEIAKQYFSKNNIVIGDPRTYLNIDVQKFKPFDNAVHTSYYSTYFINSVGVCLRFLLSQANEGINLLPTPFKEALLNKKKILLFSLASVVICIFSLFLAGFIFFKYQNLTYDRVELEIQKASVDRVLYGIRYQEIRNEILKFNSEVTKLTEIENSLFSAPAVIDRILELIPSGITLTGFKFNDEHLTMEINGIADSRENLLGMIESFRDSSMINKVITPLSTYDEKFNISFSVEMQLIFKELTPYGADPIAQ